MNFALSKSRNSYVSSSIRKKCIKARQKTTYNIASNYLKISNIKKTFNKISRIIALRLRETSSL